MPHVPLKVLRGQQDEEDVQDQLYERFQAPPGTTTEDDNNDRDDNEGSDISDDSGEARERYLGEYTSSLDSGNIDPNNVNNTPEFNTTGSFNYEEANVQVVAQMHDGPNSDVTSYDYLSNDDKVPLLPNEH